MRVFHPYMATTLAALVLGPAGTFAHHATSGYDETRTLEGEGKVVSKFWKNPHVVLHVATVENGKSALWTLEGNSVSALMRSGVTSDLINVGDKVKFAGSPSTRHDHEMLVQSLLLPNGQELLLRGGNKRHWPNAILVSLKGGIDPAAAAAAQAMGIFRVWTWGRIEPGWWFFGDAGKFPLTKSALAKAAKYNELTDNPQLKCIPPGMPATMGNPYPIQFVQVGKNIEIREEEFDVVRTLHMDGSTARDAKPSPLGYSVAHWENDATLVIETTKISWPQFNRVGVPQSPAVSVLERFVLDEKAGKLNYDLTVTDPATLTTPYKWKGLWIYKAGEVVGRYDCTTEKKK